MCLHFVIFLVFCDQTFLTVAADEGVQDHLYVVEMGDAKYIVQTEGKQRRFARKSEKEPDPRKKTPDHHYVIELEALSTKGRSSDYSGADTENVAKNTDTNYIMSTLTNLANQTGTNVKKNKKDKQHIKHNKDKQHKKDRKDKKHKKDKKDKQQKKQNKKKKDKKNKKNKKKDKGKTNKKHKKGKISKKYKSYKKGNKVFININKVFIKENKSRRTSDYSNNDYSIDPTIKGPSLNENMITNHPQARNESGNKTEEKDHTEQEVLEENHPQEANMTPNHPHQANTTPNHPHEANKTQSHPHEANMTQNHPHEANMTPNHPHEANTTPNHPHEANKTQNHPHEANMTPNHPQEANMTPNHPHEARNESENKTEEKNHTGQEVLEENKNENSETVPTEHPEHSQTEHPPVIGVHHLRPRDDPMWKQEGGSEHTAGVSFEPKIFPKKGRTEESEAIPLQGGSAPKEGPSSAKTVEGAGAGNETGSTSKSEEILGSTSIPPEPEILEKGKEISSGHRGIHFVAVPSFQSEHNISQNSNQVQQQLNHQARQQDGKKQQNGVLWRAAETT